MMVDKFTVSIGLVDIVDGRVILENNVYMTDHGRLEHHNETLTYTRLFIPRCITFIVL